MEEASETEFLAKHILAVRARRQGHIDTALERYADLLRSHPRKAEVLTNYGNLRFLNGDDEQAIELYERSAALIDSPRLMFNLSQANARLFRIEEFEAALRAGQDIDADAGRWCTARGSEAVSGIKVRDECGRWATLL